jgi:serine protease Do
MRLIYLILIIFCLSHKSFGKSAPDSFADLVDELVPAVVSIASTTIIKDDPLQSMPQFPEGSPFDEFFKDYFDKEKRRSPSNKPLIGLGSGFIIDKLGIVVTNNHVIEGADEITVIMTDQSEFTAELLGRDPKADLAVLKFDPKGKELISVGWGDSDSARVGDWSIAIGNPLGLGGTVTVGVISALSRDIGGGSYVKFIQTDASINRGNSGGPLFNIKGEVIGINAAIISQTGGSIGLGFAIPANSAKKIVSQLIEFGRTKRGWLGVQITSVSKEIAESLGLSDEKGAFISSINPDGPSKKAGLQEGDIILKFNGREISKMIDLPRLVAESEIGSIAKVEVWRKNKLLTIEVELGQLPEENYVIINNEDSSSEKEIIDLRISIVPTENNQGVKVTKVEDNSNLTIDDIIIEVNREIITSVENFLEIIKEIKITGRNSLLLKILRDGKSMWVTLTFKN